MNPTQASEETPRTPGGRRNLILLSFVSLFNDISTEMIYPLVPGFLRSLGATNTLVGVIEGIAEATASLVKSVFGWFSDRVKRRKPFVIAGYALSAVSKPLLAAAGRWGVVLGLRFTERTGKGIRTPARDALLSQSVSERRRGLGFGFHRAMDSLGAACGPLLAMLILYLTDNNVRLVFLSSVVPALIAVSLIFFVRELRTLKDMVAQAKKTGSLGRDFIWFAGIMVVFTLGNSSNAFLLLRAQDAGVAQGMVPLLWVVYSLVGSLTSPLFGALSDRIGRRWTIFGTFFVYSAVYFLFGRFSTSSAMWLLFAGYGLYLGSSQGTFRAFIADLVPAERRATAYGLFETLIGLALLPASLLFGFLWDTFSVQVAFNVGAGFSLVAASLFLFTQIISRHQRS